MENQVTNIKESTNETKVANRKKEDDKTILIVFLVVALFITIVVASILCIKAKNSNKITEDDIIGDWKFSYLTTVDGRVYISFRNDGVCDITIYDKNNDLIADESNKYDAVVQKNGLLKITFKVKNGDNEILAFKTNTSIFGVFSSSKNFSIFTFERVE